MKASLFRFLSLALLLAVPAGASFVDSPISPVVGLAETVPAFRASVLLQVSLVSSLGGQSSPSLGPLLAAAPTAADPWAAESARLVGALAARPEIVELHADELRAALGEQGSAQLREAAQNLQLKAAGDAGLDAQLRSLRQGLNFDDAAAVQGMGSRLNALFENSRNHSGSADSAPSVLEGDNRAANAAHLAPSTRVAGHEAELAENEHRVKENIFYTNRGFSDYKRFLGPSFISKLRSLKRDSHWIDLGAGNARAMREYFSSVWQGLWAEKPKMTAVVVEKPLDLSRLELAAFLSRIETTGNGGRFKYMSGRFLGDYHPGEIEPADVVTDVYGAISYSPDLSGSVEQAGGMLKPGGQLFTIIQTRLETIGSREGNVRNVIIRRPDGSEVDIADWLRQIQGLKLEVSKEKTRAYKTQFPGRPPEAWAPTTIESVRTLVLTRTSEPLRVPKLRLVGITADSPPRRTYVWDDLGT